MSDEEAGGHAVRVAARVKALETAKATRRDVEGLEDVDVEAMSTQPWKQWWRTLGPDGS